MAQVHMDIDQGGESGKQTMVHSEDTAGSSPVGGQTIVSSASTTTTSLQQQALQNSTSRPAIRGQEK